MAFKDRQEKYKQHIVQEITINKMNVQIFLKTNDIDKILKSAF